MKNFFPLFLGALLSFASFSSLNGQVELIRIQETGNREQAIIREQGTGDREQVKNNRKGVLQSEDQIDQRVGSTTNYELPTKNSNNQGNSLDCYLMMNPAVEGAEEAMELALSETRIPSKVIKSISLGVPASEANSLSSFSASGRTTANVTASSHQNKASSSEEAEISSSSDNQTLKDMLLAEIQSNIEMLGTANVAGKLLEQEEQIKNKLEQDHPNITWDWNSVNLDELIHQALEKKYELAYLASLWTENEVADQALAE
ncbi:MAG TPA: hypothetical protein VJK54_02815, partial [Chthoniobacterales bacterium]|nr:hypothetical protein [Chthoniobacterales bacterium]